MMIYAGIGSRETPAFERHMFQLWGAWFASRQITLRSGGAAGADLAFEAGCGNGPKEIFRAHDARTRPDWHEIAARYHPAWDKCSDFAKLLHARNSAIILGEMLDRPADLVICWTKDGQATGGTGQALRVAADAGIRIFNFHNPDANMQLVAFLRSRGYE